MNNMSASHRFNLVQQVQRAMLSLDSIDVLDDWLASALPALTELMGTDSLFLVESEIVNTVGKDPTAEAAPSPGIVVKSPTLDSTFTEYIKNYFVGYDSEGNSLYADDYSTLQHKLVRQHGKLAIHDELLYDPHQWRGRPLYSECYQKTNIERQMALSVPLPQGESMLIFGYHEANLPAMGDERHQLLNLLLPAFEGNVYFRQRLLSMKTDWTDRIDRVEEALAIFSTDGKEYYRNRTLLRLLATEPQADALLGALRHFVTQLQAIVAPRPGSSVATTRDITIGNQHYCLRGYLDRFLLPVPTLMISIERVSVLPSPSLLHSYFGLTNREVEITQLLVQGFTDREIAEKLFISLHTAHRHSESILRKVGISSRAGIAHACLKIKQ